MRRIAFIVAAASLFAIAPVADRFGPLVSSLVLVWLSVLVAVVASGSIQSFAIASGAAGAFGSGVLVQTSPAAAGAVLMVAAFAERTTRIRNRTARAVHVLAALASGAIAGSLTNAFASSSTSVSAVAIVVASVLAAIPLLVEADDPIAHSLDEAAAAVTGVARATLADGAELRRRAAEAELPLDRTEAARVRKTWLALLKLAEARVRLERSRPAFLVRVATSTTPTSEEPTTGTARAASTDPAAAGSTASSDGDASRASAVSDDAKAALAKPSLAKPAADAVLDMVDQRLAEHVSALSRAYAAVGTAHAAIAGLDDSAQKAVESMGESLDEVSRAMVEVRSGTSG